MKYNKKFNLYKTLLYTGQLDKMSKTIRICPECGGELECIRRTFVCSNCGLTFKRYELKEALEEHRTSFTTEELEEKRKREYLKWWFKQKNDKT